MTQIAIGNDSNNNICIMTPVPGINVTDAANAYFGANPFDEQDDMVLDTINYDYLPAYSWNVTTHALVVDMVKARTSRMDQFKVLRAVKWKSMGVPAEPNTVIIALFSGSDNTNLNSMKTMVTDEQVVLDTKTTIAELVAYLPSYLT